MKLENGFGMIFIGIMFIPGFTEFVKLFVICRGEGQHAW
jgi:hypothetical protein